MHIGSIASNARRHELSNGIISKTLDSINHSAATFGTSMKASYNYQTGLLQTASAYEPLGFTTSRIDTNGRMSTIDMQHIQVGPLSNENHIAFRSDLALGVGPLERGTGVLINATA